MNGTPHTNTVNNKVDLNGYATVGAPQKTEGKGLRARIAAFAADKFKAFGGHVKNAAVGMKNAAVVVIDGVKGLPARIRQAVRNFFYQRCKGKDPSSPEKINRAMRNIGGEPISFKNSLGVDMKGMYFDADQLIHKMNSAGVQRVEITKKVSGEKVPALVFEKNSKTESFLDSLKQMGFLRLTHRSKNGSEVVDTEGVWEQRTIDGKVYLFTKENIQALTTGCSPFKDRKFNSDAVDVASAPARAGTPAKKTIVLNGGLFSKFESTRTAIEVAKFVAMGFNVIVSEDKNPKVIDTESHQNVMANRDAIYQELERRGVANSDIIWKGTCFSSIPAVEAAAKYRGSHVWIDQGYAEAYEMVAKQVPLAAGRLASVVKPLVKAACDEIDFNYTMADHLPKVEGDVIFVRNNRDGLIDNGQYKKVEDLVRAHAGNNDFFTIDSPNVSHAGAWFNDSSCGRQIGRCLVNKGWCTGDILA